MQKALGEEENKFFLIGRTRQAKREERKEEVIEPKEERIEKELKKEKEKKRKIIINFARPSFLKFKPLLPISIIVVALLIVGLFLQFRPTGLGYAVVTQEFNYTNNVSLVITGSGEYIWSMGNYGRLKSVRLDGSVSEEGSAKVLLEYNDDIYSIFDSSKLEREGISKITFLVINNETGEFEEVLGEDKLILISTHRDNKTIVAGILKFNVMSNFNWNVNPEKLCTKWDINDINLCYGDESCCNLMGLESLGEWNSSLYLTHGRHGIGEENIIKVRLIYANYSLNVAHPYSDIVYSNQMIEELRTELTEDIIDFEDICLESCLLPSLNATEYKLVFLVENATLNIDSIRYSIEEEVTFSDNSPSLVEEFGNVTLYKDYDFKLDLSEYFHDEDGDNLTYYASDVEDVDIVIRDGIARIIPGYNFTGRRFMYFTVSDGYYNITSNVFSVDVIKKPKLPHEVNLSEYLIESQVVINKPVRWVKMVNASDNVINLSVDISPDALNVTVRDVKNNRRISEDRLKVNDKGVVKSASAYMAEKRILKIDKLKAKLESEKRRTIRENPLAKEGLAFINRELLELENEQNENEDLITGYVVAGGEKGLLTRFFEWLSGNEITGYAVLEEETSNVTSVIIEDIVEEIEVEYWTEGPISEEEDLTNGKRIVVSSDIHYENILAYTYLDDILREKINFYHVVNGSMEPVDTAIYYDENSNDLVDYIEWIVPSLSSQTYVITITDVSVDTDLNNITAETNFTHLTINANPSYVHTGQSVTFYKPSGATSLANDTITENVVLSRGASGPLCNLATGDDCSGDSNGGTPGVPTNTQWATGTCDNPTSGFGDFVTGACGGAYGCGSSLSGNDFCMNLTADGGILLDVHFQAGSNGWGSQGMDGFASFNYTRDEIVANPYADLVLYMPFDGDNVNSKLSTSYDFTTEDNDGAMKADALVNSAGCIYGNCLQLDGAGDYVDLDDASVMGPNEGTLSLWVYSEPSSEDYQGIFASQTGAGWNDARFWLFLRPSINTVYLNLGNGTDYTQTSISGTLNAQQWYHIAGTYNGTIAKLYINGSEVDTFSTKITPGVFTPLYTGIGYGDFQTRYFNGTIDEVMIFNKSLSASEISDIYNNASSRFKTSGKQSFSNQSKLNISTGYNKIRITGDYQANYGSSINLSVGYYGGSWSQTTEQVFDGDNTFDISPSTTNLTLNFTFLAGNSTNPFYTPILSSNVNALSVNLTDTTVPTVTALTLANNSNWNQSSLDFNVSISEPASWCGVSISGGLNQTMSLNSSLTGANYTNTSIADGKYTFIVSCNDTANNFAQSGTYNFLIDTVKPNITFDGGTPADNSNRAFDWIYVNVSAKDENNISTFIDFDDSLVSWWRFDEGNGTIDYMGRNDGVNVDGNATQVDNGYFGKGMSFDGNGDYVSDPTHSYSNDAVGTLSVWVKPNIEHSGAIFYISDTSVTNNYAGLLYFGGKIVVDVRVAGTYSYLKNTTNNISTGEWNHIVWTQDGTSPNVYLNGVLEELGNISAETDATGWFDDITGVDVGSIGVLDRSSGLANPFNGTIDDVMIFNRSLSAEEVRDLYANTTSKYVTNNFTSLSDGNHSFKAYSQDITGNINTTETRTVFTDVNAPVMTIITPLNNSNWNTSSMTFNISTNEQASWCGISISGNTNQTMTLSSGSTKANYTNSSIADGKYTFIVSCNDTVNNYAQSGTNNFLIDIVKPNITFENPTLSDGDTTANDWLFVNVSSADDNNISTFIDFDDSLVSWWRMDDIERDLVTNGDFSPSTGWAFDGSWSVSGSATWSNSVEGYSELYQEISGGLIDGETYRVTFDVDDFQDGSGSSLDLYLGATVRNILSGGSKSFDIVVGSGDENIRFYALADNTNTEDSFEIDNVVVKLINSVTDYTGANDGLAVNAVQTSAGKLGKGISFDGAGDYIDLDSIDIDGSGTAYTINAWIKADDCTDGTIIGDQDTANNLLLSWFDKDGDCGRLAYYTDGAGAGVIVYSTTNFEADEWRMVTFNYNGTEGAVYLDGALDSAWTTIDSVGNMDDLHIGDNSLDNNKDFNGTIDDVMIFNRSLSAVEIAALYANTTSKYVSNNFASLSEGPHTFTAYSQDIAGNINSTTRTVTTDQTAPVITIITPLNNSNWNTSIMTFNISINEQASWCGISISGNTNQTMTLNSSSTGANYTNTSIADGKYTFVVSCNDTTNHFVQSGTYNFLIDTIKPNITFDGGTPANNSNRVVDWIYVNVSAKDENNISTFIDFDNSLVSWWRMDDLNSSGDGVVDYMGRNDGSAEGNAVQTDAGYFGKGFAFDGDGDYINISDSAELGVVVNFAVSMWLYDEASGNDRMLEKGSSYFIMDDITSGNCVSGIFSFLVKQSSTNYCVDTDEAHNQNQWYHIVGVKNDTHISIYQDGLYKDSLSLTGNIDDGNLPLIIGADDAGVYFNGTIDDVMIFNRSLTQEEVYGLYANKSSEYLQVNYTGLADGAHTFKAYSQDLAGNVNLTALRTVTTDMPSPNFTITYPTEGLNLNINTSIALNYTLTSFNSMDTCWWSVDAGATNTTVINEKVTDVGLEGVWVADNVYCDSTGYCYIDVVDVTGYVTQEIDIVAGREYNVTFGISIWSDSDSTSEVWAELGGTDTPSLVIGHGAGTYSYLLTAGSDDSNIILYVADKSAGGESTEIDIQFSSVSVTGRGCSNTTIDVSEGNINLILSGNDSIGQIGSDSVNFTVDLAYPVVNITYPTAGLNLGTNTSIDLNYSVSDSNLDSCWYTIDAGVTNNSLANCANTTINTSKQNINLILYANDSVGKIGSDSVYFFTDNIEPAISYDATTDSGTVSVDSIFVNVSSSDVDSNISTFIDFDGSLVSWWRMDDSNGSANSVVDYLGRNNGTAQGDAVQTLGYMGKGFEFDGADDSINLGNPSSLNITGNLTISSWVKINEFPIGHPAVVRKNNAYALRFKQSDTTLGFFIYNDSGVQVLSSTKTSWNSGEWYYISGTYDGSNLRLYINGVEDNSLPVSGSIITSADNVAIGSSGAGGGYFNGIIDDVMIFNRTLSAEEIRGLYANTTSKYVTNNFTSLSEGSHSFKAYSQDIAGNINSTEQRTVTVNTVTQIITITTPLNNSNWNTSSMTFNISTNEQASWCGISISGNTNQTMTLSSGSTKANYTNSSIADGKYTFIVSCNDTANNYAQSGTYNFLIDTVKPNTTFDGGTPADNSNRAFDWIYVNVSAKDENNISTFIDFDNSLVSWWRMDDVSGTVNASLGCYDTDDYIGLDTVGLLSGGDKITFLEGPDVGNTFTVGICEGIPCWGAEKDCCTVPGITCASDPDATYNYQFEIDDDSVVVDYMGVNDGTAIGDAAQTDAGYFGKGFSFDSAGDTSVEHINLGTPSSLNFGENSFSIVTWVNCDTLRWQGLVARGAGYSTNGQGWILRIKNTGALEFQITNGTNGEVSDVNGAINVCDSIWHQVVVVVDRTNNNMTLWRDGIYEDEDVPLGGDYDSGDIVIGKYGNVAQNNFTGTLDDVMIFNRSLSADEIKALYANTTSKYVTNNFTSLTEGSHSFKAYSQDIAGNINSTEQRTVTTNTVEQIITIITPLNNSNWNTSVMTFNISTNEQASWCGISINGNVNQTMTLNSGSTKANYTNSSIADGSYTFIVSCNDTVNNYAQSETYNFLIDTVKPNITFDSTTDSGSVARNYIFVNASSSDDNNISTFIDFDNSLISWWRMDDVNSSGDPQDYMKRNNGTAVANAAQTDAGYLGKGFEFDGDGDSINLGDIDVIDSATELSGCAWVYHDDLDSDDTIFEKYNSGDGLFFWRDNVAAWSGRTDTYAISVYSSSGAEQIRVEGAQGISLLQTWTHVCFTYIGNDVTGLRLYVNGVEDANSPNSTVGIIEIDAGGKDLYVGGLEDTPGYDFNGSIDDVILFNRSLSAEEITALYANTTSKYVSANFTSLSEGSHSFKAYSQDIAGNINTTEQRTVTVNTVDQIITITTPLNNSNWNTSSMTFNISTNEQASWCGISISGNLNQTMTLSSGSTKANYTNSSIADGKYTFIVSCNDTANNYAQSGTNNFLIDTVKPNITFDGGTPADNSNRVVDWIYVNVSAKDENNISTFIDFDNSLVGWWRMDDVNSSGDPQDYMKRNNGTAVANAAQTDAGYLGKGFSFDGNGDYVVIANDTSLNNIQSVTVSAWIKPIFIASGSYATIFSHGTSNGADLRVILRESNGKYRIDITDRSFNADTSVDYTLNEWQHIVLTSVSGDTDFYLNGVKTDISSGTGTIVSNDNWYFGTRLSSGTPGLFYNGTIDDVMIFNRSLSAVEIQGLYANKSSEYLQVNYTSLVDGVHTFKAYSQDMAGNVNDSLEMRTVTTDLPAPNFTITYPTQGLNLSINTSISLNYTLTNFNAMDTCWWSVDAGVTNTTIVNEKTTDGEFDVADSWVEDGSYCNGGGGEMDCQVSADAQGSFTQDLGLVAGREYNVTFNINYWDESGDGILQVHANLGGTVTPILTVSDGTGTYSYLLNAGVIDSDITFYIEETNSGDDGDVTFESVSVTETGCYNTTINVPEGDVNLILYGSDSSEDVGSDSVNFTTDLTYPLVNIAYPTAGLNLGTNTSIDLNYSVSDAATGIDSCWYTIDAGVTNNSLANCANTTINTPKQNINLILYANDSAGNTNSSSVYFFTDNTEPAISYDATTDADALIKAVDNIFVNVSSSDADANISTFIDFDGSLVGWWRMDDVNSSGDPQDYMKRNNGTAQGNAAQTLGYLGKGFSFDGAGDEINLDTMSSELAGHSEGTISFWFKYPDTPATTYRPFGVTQGSTTVDIFNFYVYSNNNFYVTVRTNVITRYLINLGAVTPEDWYHAVISVNDSGNAGYLNGLVSTTYDVGSSSNTEWFDDFTALNNVRIGNSRIGIDYPFKGTIDDVMIFNRSLNANEIAALYANKSSEYLAVNYTSLSDGNHTFKAYSQDLAGNVNSTETRTVTTDTTPPTISITTPLDNTIAGWAVLLQAEITDLTSVANVTYQIRNGTLTDPIIRNGTLGLLSGSTYNATFTTNETWPYNILLNSTNLTLIIIANDTLGNKANASTYWILDNSKPAIQYVTPLATGGFYSTNFSLSIYLSNHKLNYSYINISTSGSTVYYNSTDLAQSTFYWTDLVNVTGLAEGNYTITTYANDTQGNNRTTSSWFYVDKTAPNATPSVSTGGWVDPTPDNNTITNVQTQTFNMTCNETTGSINDIWINFSNGTTYSTETGSDDIYYWFTITLNGGAYNYTGYCNDTAGNLAQTETRTVTIDLTYPGISIIYPSEYAAYVNNTVLNYTVTGGSLDSCWYSLNQGANSTAVTAGVNFTNIPTILGANNITVYCNNSIGILGSSDISFVVGDFDYSYEINKIMASDKQESDLFGYSVSISGDYAIIGAYGEDTGGSNAGAAYIFKKNSTGQYEEVNKIQASDKAVDDVFGRSVSISGDYVIVGAYGEDSDTGAAYIFKKNSTGQYEEVNKIMASDKQESDLFGYSVSISGDYAIIGAYGEDTGGSNAGASYIFKKNATGQYEEVNKIMASDKAGGDSFGTSVSILGDYAIVGASSEGNYAGAAYVFKKNSTGQFEEVNKILSSDIESWDEFGRSVSISGDYAIVGASEEDTGGNMAGAAYIFKKNSTGQYEEVNKIMASDKQIYDNFGDSVSISGDYAIVGATGEGIGGGAYIFKKNSTGQYEEVNKIQASDKQASDSFGWSVSISGDYAIVGAYYEDTGGSAAGASYVFNLVDTELEDCGTLDIAGATYTLQNNITTDGTCFIIGANNITVDMAGYSITDSSPAGAEYGFVSSGYNGTTIKNGSIYEFGRGVSVTNGYGWNITNMTIYTNYDSNNDALYGVYINGGGNNSVANSSITTINDAESGSWGSGVAHGIYLLSTSNNILTNVRIDDTGNTAENANTYALYMSSSSNNTISNLDINNPVDYGIFLSSSSGNSFTDTNIEDGSYGSLQTSAASNNNFTNLVANTVYLESSSDNNNFTDSALNYLVYNGNNNIFLNTSISYISTVTGYFYRKWYYQAYVNDTAGNNVSNANVTFYNVSGTNMYNMTTDSDGYTGVYEITEYINNDGTITYFSNYTIWVYNSTIPPYTIGGENFSRNITTNLLPDVLTIEYDATAPVITIITPLNNSNWNTSVMTFNISLDESGSMCVFSIDNNINLSMSPNSSSTGFNYTNSSIADGKYTWKVVCNDSSLNTGYSGTYNFLVDTAYPNITFDGGTPADNSNRAFDWIYVNVSAVDENNISTFIDFDGSLVGWWRMDDFGLGNNLVTNGNFESGSTGWSGGTGWSISDEASWRNDQADVIAGVSQSIGLIEGATYRVTFDVNSFSNGEGTSYHVSLNGGSGDQPITSGGSKSYDMVAQSWDNMIRFQADSITDTGGDEITIDNVEVRLINQVIDYTGVNDGTAKGNAVQTDAGKLGKGFAFDGDGDSIDLGNPSSLNITGNLTISSWVNINSLSDSYPAVVRKENAYALRFKQSDNTLGFFIYNDSGFQLLSSSKTSWNNGEWYYIVGTYDGSNLRIYVNGVEDNSLPVSGSIDTSADNVHIGNQVNGLDPFNGTIDDVMIFDRSLSAAEIQGLYANKSSEYLAVNYTSLSDGSHSFKAYAQDTAGNVNYTETRTVGTDTTAPVINITYPLNGTTYSNYITQLKYTLTETNADSCWYGNGSINYTAVTAGVNWSNMNGNSTKGSNTWTVYCNDSANNVNSSSVTFTVDNIPPNITYDTTTDADASTKAVDNIFVNVSASDATGNISTFIDFDGSLVGWWRMDDVNASGDPTDYTGRYNGTAVNNAGQTDAGYLGKGFAFDGDGDYVVIPDNDVFEANQTTISMWVYQLPDAGHHMLISKRGPTYNTGWMVIDVSGNNIYFDFGGSAAVGGRWITGYDIPDETWTHLVVTYNGTDGTIYANGVEEGTNTFGNLSNLANSVDVLIGRDSSGNNDYYYNGTIDDVMIFNRSLSAEEIRGLYANKSSEYLAVNYTSLTDGTHTFKAYTQDMAGNVNSTETRTVTTDTTPPTISYDSTTDADGLTKSVDNIFVNVSASDAIGNISTFIDFDNSLVGWWRMDDFESPNLVTNGDFESGTDYWTLEAGWSDYGGSANWHDDSGSGNLYQDISGGIVGGVTYRVTFDVSSFINEGGSSFEYTLGGDSGYSISSSGSKTKDYVVSGGNDGRITFRAISGGGGDDEITIDNVEVRLLNQVIDYTGVNDGTAKGNAVQTDAGYLGKGFEFDGDDDYITAPTSYATTPIRTETISVWAYRDGDSTGNDVMGIFSVMNTNDAFNSQVGIWVHEADNDVSCHIFSDPNGFTSGYYSFNEKEWTYFTCTYEYIGTMMNISLYINGEYKGSGNATITNYQQAANIFKIGSQKHGGPNRFWNGTIDDVMIFNRSLSAVEVRGLYANKSSEYLAVNYTSLSDGNHTFKAYSQDTAGKVNSTETRTVTTDTTFPTIDYTGGTLADESRVWQDYIYVNLSLAESNFVSITFQLRNSTAIVNTTTYTTQTTSINWTGLVGDDYWYTVNITDLAGNVNTTTRKITPIDSEANISLNTGWNLVAPILRSTDSGTDRNITIVDGWNLIGHSSEDPFDISTITFTNTSGDTTTWANTIAQKKLYGYLAYYDSSSATASERKYKYAGASGVDETTLTADRGYWLNARQNGTLTLPAAGGTLNTSTYAWSKLRFHNGTDELNITDADSAGWIDRSLQFYDNGFKYICVQQLFETCNKGTILPWEGVFIRSYKDNITLIRQN